MAKFSDFSQIDKIIVIKEEFSKLIRSVFDNPTILKSFIDEKLIDNNQSKSILQLVNKCNSKTCVCCRRYDPSKIKLVPVEPDLEPLVDVARNIAEKKNY